MSEASVVNTTVSHRDARDNDSSQWTDDRDLQIPENFLNNFIPPFDDYIAESWLPQPSPSWDTVVDPRDQWSPDLALLSRPLADSRPGQEDVLYAIPQTVISHPQFVGPEYPSIQQIKNHATQPTGEAINQMGQYFGEDFLNQTPVTTHPESDFTICGPGSFQLSLDGYPTLQDYGNLFIHEQPGQFWTSSEEPLQKSIVDANSHQARQSTNVPQHGLVLDWSVAEQPSVPSTTSRSIAPAPKRKATSDRSPTRSNPAKAPRLSEFVDVFENAPGALASVKRRKKLDAPVRKAAREVRKAGACHQC